MAFTAPTGTTPLADRCVSGCVNLPTDEAQWFYNFAEVGTPVRVI